MGLHYAFDFSDLPVYKLIAFFREANFDALTMKPFRAQYLPTNTSNEDSNRSLRDRKADGDLKGKEWTSKYLFHIPLKQAIRHKNDSSSDENDTLPEGTPLGYESTPVI